MSQSTQTERFRAADIQRVFNRCFIKREHTVLETGGAEPIYLPRDEQYDYHRIVSTRDYFASALHEVSHWCIAGKARRQQVDYGYWYEADGRSECKQREFERVEVKPQALEWVFARACGAPFRISADNADNPEVTASRSFVENVARQAQRYVTEGLPERAEIFTVALLDFYDRDEAESLRAECFDPLFL